MTVPSPIRLVIVEDHPLMQGALTRVVKRDPRVDVVATLDRADELPTVAADKRADVVLLDLQLPGADPLDSLPERSAVLIFSSHDEPSHIRRALAAGVAGYIHKSVPQARLREAIRSVADGARCVIAGFEGGGMSSWWSRGDDARPEASADAPGATAAPAAVGNIPDAEVAAELGLTRREFEVFRYLVGGCTNLQIALALGIAHRTVETHRARLQDKLSVIERSDLIRIARDRGVDPLFP